MFAFAGGCGDVCEDKHTGIEPVPRQKLDLIEPLELHPAARQDASDANSLACPVRQDQEQTTVSFDIEQCRAAALENNLDLKVQLFGPAISRKIVNEANARFEPLAFSGFDFVKTDTPISQTLDASQAKSHSASAGLAVPLRTGGEISLYSPFNRTETDNIFSTLNPAYSSDFVLSLSQPLLRGGGLQTNTHAIRIACYDAQIVQAQTKLEVMRVLAAVDRVYWRLYAAYEELKVCKQQYDLATAQLERAKRKVSAGEAAEIEIIRAEYSVAQQIESIILAENAVRDRQRDLKRIMNKPGLDMESATTLVPATRPGSLRYELDTRGLLEYALANRMELLEVQLRLAQDADTIDFERNGTLPALALNYTYNINGLGASTDDSYDLMFQNRFVDHRVGLRLEVPLGNKAARNRLQRAILQQRQQLATRTLRQEQIKQEVLNAADQLEANWQRIVASHTNVVLAQRTYNAEQRQFELGLQTSTEVLDAQTNLADAQSAHINALVEYQIAQVDLAYATGTLLGAARVQWYSAD